MRELSPLFGTSQSWVHITSVHRPVTHVTPSEGLTILLPFLRAEHTCCLTAAILDFAKGAFFEANRGKDHTLYLYLLELLICVKGITEVAFYFFFSFTVKEGSKEERKPIANRQLLYQSSLLPHFLPHGATVTTWTLQEDWEKKNLWDMKVTVMPIIIGALCIITIIMAGVAKPTGLPLALISASCF